VVVVSQLKVPIVWNRLLFRCAYFTGLNWLPNYSVIVFSSFFFSLIIYIQGGPKVRPNVRGIIYLVCLGVQKWHWWQWKVSLPKALLLFLSISLSLSLSLSLSPFFSLSLSSFFSLYLSFSLSLDRRRERERERKREKRREREREREKQSFYVPNTKYWRMIAMLKPPLHFVSLSLSLFLSFSLSLSR
jgi:hypothetical protein